MKQRSYLMLLAFLMMILSSCTKVINLELNDADKKYVIEAVITDQPGTAKVTISQTKNFDESNDFPTVSGATVMINPVGGNVRTLSETSQGTYEAPTLFGVPGNTYHLSVTIGTQEFTADCKMPLKVNFDSLFVTNEFLFTGNRKIANVNYQDPMGMGNNYRFVQYVNGIQEKQYFIENDDYDDGRPVNSKLYFFPDDDTSRNNIRSGDQLEVDMLCIDPTIYKYWFSLLRSSTGSDGGATPANPVSDMQGGALGYFSAQTFQRKTITVP